MRRTAPKQPTWLLLFIAAPFALALPATAQLGEVKKFKKTIESEAKKSFGQQDPPGNAAKGKQAQAGAESGAEFVFSTNPIDPAEPQNLTNAFKAGDHIYGLIQVNKSWRDLLGKGDRNATKIEVPVDLLVDGQKLEFQYITIKRLEAIDSNFLVFDVAPAPEQMTAYKDPGFVFAEGKGNRRIGPDTYTYNLAELSPGTHTVRFQVRSYGDIFSSGEFEICGDDYSVYAKLREEILKVSFSVATMPKAQLVNRQLEANMHELLRNAGWTNIRKLGIVDKDWWLDRVDGGDTAIQSRHIAAAVAAKADDGSFYWCVCTFHQYKQLDGSFGPLELTHTGERKPILEENIDK